MISLEEARARVLAGCGRLPSRRLELDDCVGCVTSEAIVANANVPPFANSAMDGYAVRAADVAGASPDHPVKLSVTGILAAGAAPSIEVGAGQAIQIMTGAPFPAGADAIAIVEVTRQADGGAAVLVQEPATAGMHVRPAGEDIAAGQEVFPAGTLLGPGHLGVLASIGREKVPTYGRARVGVLSTGDELVDGPGELQPGQIRDSNRHTLLALARHNGFDAVDLGVAADDEGVIRDVITRGLASCDALLTSGGVSMGEFDYVKKVLDELGEMQWMQIAIRPAKPLAFGLIGGKPVIGLPGNPVSSMVSFELFARPALRQMMGVPDDQLDRPRIRAIADEPLRRRPDGKTHLARVVADWGADGRCHVRFSGGQASNLLRAMALADALAFVPDGEGVPASGDVDVWFLS
ncbi:MAG TPA: gephyrin-like molybdotransferase Glp [Acidimicrobiales bacterium]